MPWQTSVGSSNPPCQVELTPGGRDVAVTNANKLSYIHRVANFRLNTQLVRQLLLLTCSFMTF